MKDKVTRLMRRLGHRYTLIGLALVVIAAMLVALYVPLALAVTTNGVINACYPSSPSNSTQQILPLSVVKTDGSDVCPSGYTKLSWNIQGVKGDPGPAGPAGPEGPKGDPGDPSKAFFKENSSNTDGLVVQEGLEAGNYVITGSVQAFVHSPDNDAVSVNCDIKLNDTTIAEISESPGSWTKAEFRGDASLSTTTARSAANGDTLFFSCSSGSIDPDAGVHYDGKLTAIRVGSIG